MHDPASSPLRVTLVAGCAALLTTLAPARVAAFNQTPQAGREGEIDVNAQFAAHLGQARPTQRRSTWQSANIKILSGGIGYTVGSIGPLQDVYARLGGGYFSADPELVERDDDLLPPQTSFFDQDRGGFVTATVSANLVKGPRYAFGVFAQGTVPLDANLEKLSNVHLHFGAAGVRFAVTATPGAPVHFGLYSELFVGSGSYLDAFQHNAAVSLSNLLVLETAQSVMSWRLGVSFGPYFEADLNTHRNEVYRKAYGAVDDGLADQQIRSIELAVAVLPYLRITDHVTVKLGLVHTVSGSYLPATQRWTGGLRVAF